MNKNKNNDIKKDIDPIKLDELRKTVAINVNTIGILCDSIEAIMLGLSSAESTLKNIMDRLKHIEKSNKLTS